MEVGFPLPGQQTWSSLLKEQCLCARVLAASAAPRAVPLETSLCLLLLEMTEGVTGLVAHGSLKTTNNFIYISALLSGLVCV